MNSIKISKPEAISYMVHIVLFILAEIFCIISNIKCFAKREFRSEIPLIIVYVSLHLLLILSTMFFIFTVFNFENATVRSVIGYFVLLPKDIFILTLTWRILDTVAEWDEDDTSLRIAIKLVWVILIGHVIGFVCIFCVGYETFIKGKEDYERAGIYCSLAIGVISILYIFACVKAIRFWKNTSDEKPAGYLKWLFITMLYMILSLAIRIIINIGQVTNLQNSIKEINIIFYLIYISTMFTTTNLIPPILMSYCLLVMASEYTSQNATNSEDLNDYS